ncbi:MAG TPA: HK97 gp10 family phage protein [Streptosporangiaceae bacterium]
MAVQVSGDPALTIGEDLRLLPIELRKSARPRLRRAGDVIASAAKNNASWSKRIPPTIRVRTSFRFERETIYVIAGGPTTPHARPYEGAGGKASFRHPVHGNREVWVAQPTRPYLWPAGKEHGPEAEVAIRQALNETAAKLGFS